MQVFKWIATAILIIGSFVNALGFYPLGPIIMILGGLIWTIISYKMQDMALLTTNVVVTSVTIIGLGIAFS